MKHLTVELAAIDELISERSMQSVEFPMGNSLVNFLIGIDPSPALPPSISAHDGAGGVFLLGRKPSASPKYLVFDDQQSAFFEKLSRPELLFAFQKTLRFAKKMWSGFGLTNSERIITGTSKAVLFPFQFSQHQFRIVIERQPLEDRLARRPALGELFLVYKAGFESGDPSETPSFTNFRKVLEAIPGLSESRAAHGASQPSAAEIDQMGVTKLADLGDASPSMFRGYTEWLALLTESQRKFVEAPIVGGHRIEGPAGTGKTLSLILKALFSLRASKAAGVDLHIAFITHSDATRDTIQEALQVMDGDQFYGQDRLVSAQSLKVCTLSELCADQLRQAISETEFIDRDALESKGLQLLYISEAIDETMAKDFATHERFLSDGLASFFRTEKNWSVAELVQHEISVIIKGRAADNIDTYKKIPPLKYGIPISGDADKAFIFTIFRKYQEKLRKSGQFDTDDVVITTIGQLDTPIWRRRRARQGYDAIFVDETHLFNINELHVFHHFTKTEGPYPIIYSIDRSQAVGDRGWTTAEIAESVAPMLFDALPAPVASIKTIFRSSPDIVNLAFSVVAAGATLFTNFDNPLELAASGFTSTEEALSVKPFYREFSNDDAMLDGAFTAAEQMAKEMGCRKSDILIVSLDEALVAQLQASAEGRNKPVLLLKRRGDLQAVESARRSGQMVLAHADYVGGLEFAGVVIVGLDRGRVPPEGNNDMESSRRYQSYASHNRLYVAITRAKYRIGILADQARGPSKLIEPALAAGVLDRY